MAERRDPHTSDVGQLLDRYFDQFDGSPNTLYRSYVRNHISPGGVRRPVPVDSTSCARATR